MPANLPDALIARIDQLLLERVARIKQGQVALRFIGVPQDAAWRNDAARTVTAAFRMFLPDIMADPIMDTTLMLQIMREVHLTGLKTAQDIPIKQFLDDIAKEAGLEHLTAPALPEVPPPTGAQDQAPDSAPGLRRTQSSSNLGKAGPGKLQRTNSSPSLKKPTPAQKATVQRAGISLKPMLDLMKYGIVKRHPAIVEFLHAVVETIQSLDTTARVAYLQHIQRSVDLKKTVYLTYVLDLIVVAMGNSKEFAFEVQTHFYRELQQRGIDPFDTFATFRGIMALPNSTLFKGAKTISVFPAMTMYIARRFNNGNPPSNAQISAIANHLSWADRMALGMSQQTQQGGEDTGLLINMEEAVIADFSAGRKDNAAVGAIYCSRLYGRTPGVGAQDGMESFYYTGWVLPVGATEDDADYTGAAHPFYDAMKADAKKKDAIRINGQPMARNYYAASYDDDWASLYHTWNLAFILGEIPDLDVMAPKLLAPSVMNAKGNQYLYCRVHALFVAICFLIMKCSDRTQNDAHPPNNQAMARLYGAINLEQAWLYLVKRKGNAAGTKEDFLRYWDEAAPSLVGGALGYARLAAHAFLGWTSKLMD